MNDYNKEQNFENFLENNLFSQHTIKEEFSNIYNFDSNIDDIFENIKSIYNPIDFQKKNEHQFEDDFISKVLSILSWQTLRQEIKIIQGKQEKPDFTLFTTIENKKAYESLEEQRYYSNEFISLFCESKAYNVEIDNKKIKDNPHFQILNYLNNLKVRYGFLTNGRKWRFYDNEKFTSQKVFYEINLEYIIQNDDIEAFKYFYYIFRRENFEDIDNVSQIAKISKKDNEAKISIEENLKSVIYGYNNQQSIFEAIGVSIYNSNKNIKVEEIYENSVYLIFRLLFIAYFEDKYEDTLKKHLHYNGFSLKAIFDFLQTSQSTHFTGYRKLKELVNILDNGDDDIDIPLFNGGLFDSTKTPILNGFGLIDNETLKFILDSLYYFQEDGKSLFKRDFKTLSIAHIGKIYEGILSFRFEVVEEDIYYIEYTEKNSKAVGFIDGYFDGYDYELLKKTKKIVKEDFYKKGTLVLKNASNSRKTTASYYTPQSLSKFLVKESIENAIKNGKNILELKILDNSCGSGHFLVESLDYISSKALSLFEDDEALKKSLEDEKIKIEESVSRYTNTKEIDELDVLKRVLLKKIIFGIDLNPFAVELTRLSLWMDSFIFGTPLSFIEHHIKCGNALIGANIDRFLEEFQTNQTSLFTQDLSTEFKELSTIYEKLDNLKDSTTQDIEESKMIYKFEIAPKVEKLNNAINLLSFIDFKSIEKDDIIHTLKADSQIAEKIFSQIDSEFLMQIKEYASRYHFFNYEIEFPEVFHKKESHKNGFDIIIGNPPWDKTKFSDNDFFPQFVSNYRTLKDSQKKEVRENTLAKAHVKSKYESDIAFSKMINEYYKMSYPLNKGAGDGNLFRFFTEKNLTLLNQKGTLNYVLPSALMFEEGSKTIREHIINDYALNIFYSFENRENLFEIDERYKFAVMQIENKKDTLTPIKTMFYKTNPISMENSDEVIEYKKEVLKLLSPSQLAFIEVRDKKELTILTKCYSQFKPLDEHYIDFRNELHMTNDKSIFIEECKEGLLPLYEGKMIWQYDSVFGGANYFLDKEIFDNHLIDTEARRLIGEIYPTLYPKDFIGNKVTPQIKAVLEHLGLKYDSKNNANNLKVLHKFVRFDREFFRLGFRAVASDTNERTLIFSLLPKDCGFGHSMFANCPKNYYKDENLIKIDMVSNVRILFLQTIFNSLIVDFIARGMIQINVSKTYLYRLPIPQLSDDEILKEHKELLLNGLKLSLKNDFETFKELADEFGIKKTDLPTTPKQWDFLQIKNDCMVAKMFNISKDELEYILSTFKVLKNKKPQYVSEFLRQYEDKF
ncbi:MAG: restriction endonuclease [Sulfurovum sp.]|nr:MAG: restriction endonuclease [Sulfurovum sp.]